MSLVEVIGAVLLIIFLIVFITAEVRLYKAQKQPNQPYDQEAERWEK